MLHTFFYFITTSAPISSGSVLCASPGGPMRAPTLAFTEDTNSALMLVGPLSSPFLPGLSRGGVYFAVRLLCTLYLSLRLFGFCVSFWTGFGKGPIWKRLVRGRRWTRRRLRRFHPRVLLLYPMTAAADCLSLMARLEVRTPPRPCLPQKLSWEESAARRKAHRQQVRLLRYPWLSLSRAERRQARRDLARQRYFMARDKKVADQRRAAVCSSLRKCREIINSVSSSSWSAYPTPFYVGYDGERVPLLHASKCRGPEPPPSLPASSAFVSTIYFTPLQGPRSSRRVCLSVPLSATVQALLDAIIFAEGPLPNGALTFAGGSLTCLSRTLDTYGLYDGCSVGFAPYLGRGGMPTPSRSRD